MAQGFRSSARWISTAAAAVATLTSAGAQAQSAPSVAMRWAKTEAILGGAPSALQAILAQQQGTPLPPRAELRPAAYAPRPISRAVIRDELPEISAAVASGRPDVFGSVALKVRSTRLDWRWRKVERAGLSGAAARYAETLADLDAVERLQAVNNYVNGRVEFMDDSRQYGRADVWSAAADTLQRGRGDCEDYAIAKLQMLRRAGVADRDLYLVIVKDLVTRADHAVLVVRAAGRMHVLDNGTDKLLDSEAIRDYRPVLTFASGGTWTHGYRMKREPNTAVATADDNVVALAPAAATQRSWSASLLALDSGFNK
jgi:predicted transglutaminase-like cysteine proteinase